MFRFPDPTPGARAVELFAMATVFGATVWFFFIQSPVLMKHLGREAFVPLQMRLTVVLFQSLEALLFAMVGAALLTNDKTSPAVLSACVALLGGLINKYAIVPLALQAGGRTLKDIKDKDHEGSTAGFASEGGGSKTKTLHRTVVLFVVIMLAGTVWHGLIMLN